MLRQAQAHGVVNKMAYFSLFSGGISGWSKHYPEPIIEPYDVHSR